MSIQLSIYIIASTLLATDILMAFALFKQKHSKKKQKYYTSKEEVAFHERELNAYIGSPKSNVELGLMYERYIGYLLETDGYSVEFCGARKKFKDQGRDLIAKNKKETLIIQTKHWSKSKVIREKYINQLFGTTEHYRITNKKEKNVKAVLFATTDLSLEASDIAIMLEVGFNKVPYNKYYPMIKCNITTTGERIFHLPWDDYYDRVKIDLKKGEFYALTVNQAVAKGFRRAFKTRSKRSA